MSPTEGARSDSPSDHGATDTRVSVETAVAWADTDASGHYHYSTVLRWMEAAEVALYEHLGVPQMFGTIPRAHVEVDFLRPVWFRDRVRTTVAVARLGRSSLTLEFELTCAGEPVARASQTVVHVDGAGGSASPWPEDVRRLVAAHIERSCMSSF